MNINLKEKINNPIFRIISDSSRQLNVESFVIGGFVRDVILDRTNDKKDIDIVVQGSGIELAKKVANYDGKRRKVAIYKNFGTAMLQLNGFELEFVGARKESYRANSRNPIVENGTLEDDQKRRDFTINAMSISLQEESFGNLIDPFNGFNDLNCKILKTPLDPNQTYIDDPLRMMRAIRFATQLGFKIEDDSLKSITLNKDRINIISKERIIDELNKIILSARPSLGFKLLFKTGLLEIIFPQFTALHGVEIIDGKAHKDNFYHTLQVLDNVAEKSNNLWLRWAAIMHDIAKPPTKKFHKNIGWTFHGHEDKGARMVPPIFKQLKLPLDGKMKYVQKLVKLHLRPIALVKDTVTDSGIRRLLFDAGDDLDDLMTLCEADITSKNEHKVKRYITNFKIVRNKLIELEEKDKIRNFQPPITGEEIMETFNIKPCKAIGDIKTEIKDAILDGKIKNNSADARKLMLELGKKMGLESGQNI